VELKSLDQAGVCEPLEPSLRGRHRTGRIQPAMNLAAEHMAEFAKQSERREVGSLGLEVQERRAGNGGATCPPGAIEIDELAIARSGSAGQPVPLAGGGGVGRIGRSG
jgi:hypothetical protein